MAAPAKRRWIGARVACALLAGAILAGASAPASAAGHFAGGMHAGRGGYVGYGFAHRGYWGPRTYGHFGHYHYYRPHAYFGFGLTFGDPWWYYPPPAYVVEPAPVVVDPSPTYVDPAPPFPQRGRVDVREEEDFDVTNQPPAGCHYYDPYCGRRFDDLDDYTEHLDSHHHARTLSIVDDETGRTVHRIEFVNGEWQPLVE